MRMDQYPRRKVGMAAAASLAALTIASCTSTRSSEMPGKEASTPTVTMPAQTPEQAYNSILKGTSCEISSADIAGKFPSASGGEIIGARLQLKIIESVGSLAAREQYATNSAVRWDGHQNITAIAYSINNGHLIREAGNTDVSSSPVNSENAFAALPGTDPGLEYAIYNDQIVSTDAHKQTTEGALCGVLRVDGDRLVVVDDTAAFPHQTVLQ